MLERLGRIVTTGTALIKDTSHALVTDFPGYVTQGGILRENSEQSRRVAYHEAGHAVMATLLQHPVQYFVVHHLNAKFKAFVTALCLAPDSHGGVTFGLNPQAPVADSLAITLAGPAVDLARGIVTDRQISKMDGQDVVDTFGVLAAHNCTTTVSAEHWEPMFTVRDRVREWMEHTGVLSELIPPVAEWMDRKRAMRGDINQRIRTIWQQQGISSEFTEYVGEDLVPVLRRTIHETIGVAVAPNLRQIHEWFVEAELEKEMEPSELKCV
jgi:hypothetical protein